MAELSDRLKGACAVLIVVSISPFYITNGAWRGVVTQNYEEFRGYVNDGWQAFKYACETIFNEESPEKYE